MLAGDTQGTAEVSQLPAKPRKWWIAGFLSLLVPGLGQLYNGQAKKAILFYLLAEGLPLLWAILIVVLPSVYAVIGAILLIVAVHLFIIVEAVLSARRVGDAYRLKLYNNVYAYIIIALFLSLALQPSLGYVTKEFLIEAFKIPTSAMEPTLIVSDHILAEKFSKAAKEPRRGDIIVFKSPQHENKNFVKRVVGIAGDVVELRNKTLYVNGQLVQEDYISPSTQGTVPTFGPITVPANSLFVMGDNRENSLDSRIFGFVNTSNVIGHAKVIYWSWDRGDIKVRWDRVGRPL